ncbi:hypothetical protein [Marimonas arenosa]|uniref:Uncharacterized protein n=1 Tax=Marimonas arenosa TaxID=1795305 RepID=A0AAE3WEK8_9RHOB|nr:hypothetical protein [Marimonas arenosa]MDQ2090265.1 hypothetical protein [Marimonas arenosa]
MRSTIAAAGLAVAACATPIYAQTNALYGDQSVIGNLCVGYFCTTTESFDASGTLKLKNETIGIFFDDTSTAPGYPDGDWRLLTNDASQGGASHFTLEDADGVGAVFRVEDGARAHALHVGAGGGVGLGTSLPGATLHMVSGTAPGLRFEQDGSGGQTPQSWQIAGDHAGLRLHDLSGATVPFAVLSGAPDSALVLDQMGRLGLGIAAPAAGLHLRSATGTARMRIEEQTPATGPRALLNLQNNGRPEIVMGNSSTNGEWSFGAGTNFILKQGALGSVSSAKTRLFQIDPAGNAVLTGTLTTGGPGCSAGCDAVFSDDYDLPSIAEHAERMFALGHLPNVGPTVPGVPLDLTERSAALLNELEHAHIYIAELERRDAAQNARIARLEALLHALAAMD